jgi:hypothetical protein
MKNRATPRVCARTTSHRATIDSYLRRLRTQLFEAHFTPMEFPVIRRTRLDEYSSDLVAPAK